MENDIGLSFALKVLEKNVQVEKRGVESVMRIQSNRLVSIQDYGKTTDDEDCILMEYLPASLEDILAERPINELTAFKYFIEILLGLKVLERNNILHRDIKPANLFVLEDIIKIGDFGTARYISGESSSKTSGVGTLHYMAPEAFHNKYGFAADRWSAAVVYYRMLTGTLVFQGDDPAGIMGSIVEGKIDTDLLSYNYRPFFGKCFQKDPEKRYQSIDAMMKAAKNIRKSPEIQNQIREKKLKPVTQQKTKYKLRDKPIRAPNEKFYKILGLHSNLRPLGYIKNDFKDNKNNTVTDRATGLIWQKSGSDTYIDYKAAQEYIQQLNRRRFAGYNNWRMPTVEELISLLEQEKQSNNLYVSSLFDKKQLWCWSSDKRSLSAAWHVQFDRGYFHYFEEKCYVRAVRSLPF